MKIVPMFSLSQTFWLSKLSRGAISANNGEEVKGLEEKNQISKPTRIYKM